MKEDITHTVPAGHVIWQSPRQETEIEKGDKVEVVFSKGAREKPVKTFVQYVTIKYLPE